MRNRIQDEPRGSDPVGLFLCPRGGPDMGYRKVGYLEQIWYIIRYKLRELFGDGKKRSR